jgi:hypothetical protein
MSISRPRPRSATRPRPHLRQRASPRTLHVALGGTFHEPVEGFRPIWRFGMIAAGLGGDLDDPVLGQTESFEPAAHMGPGRSALPPGGQGGVSGKTECTQKLCEEPIKTGFPRLRVLLLLYGFP